MHILFGLLCSAPYLAIMIDQQTAQSAGWFFGALLVSTTVSFFNARRVKKTSSHAARTAQSASDRADVAVKIAADTPSQSQLLELHNEFARKLSTLQNQLASALTDRDEKRDEAMKTIDQMTAHIAALTAQNARSSARIAELESQVKSLLQTRSHGGSTP